MCEKRILNNTKIIQLIDDLIFEFQRYLLNEYIHDLKENHEYFLYDKYTKLLNLIYHYDKDKFKENFINYLSDCLKKEINFINFLKFNPKIENTWIYNTYSEEIQKLSKKFLFDIINELRQESFFTRQEFFELIEDYKKQFKIRDKIKEYKQFLLTAKIPKNKKQRNIQKIKKILKENKCID